MAETVPVNQSPQEQADDPQAMVAVFSSSNRDAEMEAMAVQGLMDANGIDAITVGPHVLPTLEFQVQVPAECELEARRLIIEAKASGPQAAAEAELATERGHIE